MMRRNSLFPSRVAFEGISGFADGEAQDREGRVRGHSEKLFDLGSVHDALEESHTR